MALIEDDTWKPCEATSVILHERLDHYVIHHEVTACKFRNEYVREHREGFPVVWSRKQTTCLYTQVISKGVKNLKKIQQQKLLCGFSIIEIHDRALILLMLHRLKIFNDGVSLLHCWESKTSDMSLPTWLSVTQDYLDHYYMYHGFCEDDDDRLPNALWCQGRLKIMRAYKIIHEYLNFYDRLEGSFDRIYTDLDILNFDVITREADRELPFELCED